MRGQRKRKEIKQRKMKMIKVFQMLILSFSTLPTQLHGQTQILYPVADLSISQRNPTYCFEYTVQSADPKYLIFEVELISSYDKENYSIQTCLQSDQAASLDSNNKMTCTGKSDQRGEFAFKNLI